MKTLRLVRAKSIKIKPVPPYSFKLTVRKFTRFGVDWFWFTPHEIYKEGVMYTATFLERSNKITGFKLWSDGDVFSHVVQGEVYLPRDHSRIEEMYACKLIEECLASNVEIHDFYNMGGKYPFFEKTDRKSLRHEGIAVSKFV
jgi:hypothetical protein